MRVEVATTLCAGHARCHAEAGALFPLDDLGYLSVTEIDVPADQAAPARRAVAACPERALRVVGD